MTGQQQFAKIWRLEAHTEGERIWSVLVVTSCLKLVLVSLFAMIVSTRTKDGMRVGEGRHVLLLTA